MRKSPGKLVQNVLNTYLVSFDKIPWEIGSKCTKYLLSIDKISWDIGSKCTKYLVSIDKISCKIGSKSLDMTTMYNFHLIPTAVWQDPLGNWFKMSIYNFYLILIEIDEQNLWGVEVQI